MGMVLFEHAVVVMLAYNHPQNWPNGVKGKPLDAFPPELVHIVSDYSRYFIAGKTPEPVAALLRKGTPANGPEEIRDQLWVGAYRLAVKEGVIADHKPTATLADAFAVTLRTIERWTDQQAKKGIGWRDVVPAGEQQDPSEYILRRMREAGARYMKKGRLQ